MAFQNLRNNHQIYILYKDAVPTLEIGKVTNVSVPVPKYGNPSMYNDLVLDITVDVDGKQFNFQKIPSNSEILFSTETIGIIDASNTLLELVN